jgi:eukaryotic-like serine/threonine-protein kinase
MDWSGRRLGQYRIESRLGAGGMGEVYRARDERLDRDVAIKLLPRATLDDPTARARLLREARAAAALNHPNVCTVFEVGEADGHAYIAMELVEGRTLDAMLAAGPLPTRQVLLYARQLAGALAHAHARGVVHRDLKSANVIVTPDGRVKVLDFGLAKRTARADVSAALTEQTALTRLGTVMGTLPYMAPEQLRGQPAQTESDIWAFGVMLSEMVSGTRPFAGQTEFELSAAILSDPPRPLPPEVPAGIRSVTARCLDKDPARRYATGSALCAALETIQAAGEPSHTTAVAGVAVDDPRLVFSVSRRRALWLASALVLILASGLGVWRALQQPPTLRTLAVLPLENADRDPDLEYLCDGIADSLIRQIGRLRSVRVSGLESVLHLKDRQLDPAAAGRQLGVESMLVGTLQREGERLEIAARLVDVATGRQLWTHRYDLDAAELLDVQDAIASAIMDEGLRVRLTADERQRLVRHPTTVADAYDMYLQAGYLQRRATEEDYLYSRELLRRAVILDPKFAVAYAALAGNHGMMVTDGFERPSDGWPQVNRYMRQALEIDPELPEAHAYAHSLAFLFDWDWAGAERARQRLLAYPPGDINPGWLRPVALELWATGRSGEALALARRTRELDPMSPYLAVLEADYLLRDGQLDAAVALYERAARIDPENPNALFGLAEARLRQGRFDEALAARRQAHAIAGDDRLDTLFETASGEGGYRLIDHAWVRLQLDALHEREPVAYVSPLDFARAHAQLGERDLAFRYLDAAFADRSPGLVFLKVDPAWDAIRDDPRFAVAVGRVGLP